MSLLVPDCDFDRQKFYLSLLVPDCDFARVGFYLSCSFTLMISLGGGFICLCSPLPAKLRSAGVLFVFVLPCRQNSARRGFYLSLFSPAGKTPLGGSYLPRCGGFACLSARRSFPCGAVKFRRAARFRSLKDSGEFKRQALVAQFGFVVFRRLPLFCGAAVVFPLGKNSFACIIVFGRSPPFNAEFFYGFRRNAAVGRNSAPFKMTAV